MTKVTSNQADIRYIISDLTQEELDIIAAALGEITTVMYGDEELDSFDLYLTIDRHASDTEVKIS